MPADPAEGERLKEEAIAEVEAGASPLWKDIAYAGVHHLAHTRLSFTADDVMIWIEDHFPTVTTRDNRAMGPVMRRAQKEGLIQPTDIFEKAGRPGRHRGPARLWDSNVLEDMAW